jgi:phytoene/squalene synthetase
MSSLLLPKCVSSLLLPKAVSSADLEKALSVVEGIAAKDRSNLYLTSQFFEDRARYEAFISMYAVMRSIDDFIDNVPDKATLSHKDRLALKDGLDKWERRICDSYAEKPLPDPLDVSLSAAVKTFPVPIKIWLNFISAMRFDIDYPRFADFAQFLNYGEGAAAAPTGIYIFLLTSVRSWNGRYLIEDFDHERCSRELGLFAYLAHILRDVVQDMKMGLIYLSIADLHAHDLDEVELREIIASGESDNRWLSLTRDICIRAHEMERRGLALAESQYPKMDRDCRFILCLIITIYQELLDRIEKHPEHALHGSSMLSHKNKITLACKAAERTGYPFSKVVEGFSI